MNRSTEFTATGIKLFHMKVFAQGEVQRNSQMAYLFNYNLTVDLINFFPDKIIFLSFLLRPDKYSSQSKRKKLFLTTNSLTCDWPNGCCFVPFLNISLNEEQICWQPCFVDSSGKCIQLVSLMVPDQTHPAHRSPPLLM